MANNRQTEMCIRDSYCIAVKEQGDDIVFLRKIVRGGADKKMCIRDSRSTPEDIQFTNRITGVSATIST